MFTAQARRTPQSIALVGTSKAFTYVELDALTNILARRLCEAGVRTETVVGCWSHNSVSTVLQILSVLKSGAAYLLLDPNLPIERLHYMIEDTGPVCFLSDTEFPQALCGLRTEISMDEITAQTNSSTSLPRTDVAPENLAYVAYTSGSTGRPKGVLITHAAVANHSTSLRTQLDLRPGDRLPLMAPIAFDMSTEEILPPLVSGCTLFESPHRSPSMQQFTDEVSTSGYTILNIPAPLWHQWTTYLRSADTAVPPTLRLVIVGSDKIYTNKLQEWKALRGANNVRWVAAYGVTEATVTSLLYLTATQDDLTDEPLVPIGIPLNNVIAHVVCDDGRLASPGQIGELYIGGAGVARGYQRLPAMTAQRFVDDRFISVPKSKCYRTGDVVRRRSDGVIVWLGRQDSQIKINGLRIEPPEIEATIHDYPAVSEAVVVFKPPSTAADTGGFVAYVEANADTRVDPASLHSFLAARLHPLMLPTEIVLLDRIPLNASGKIDRKALEEHGLHAVS